MGLTLLYLLLNSHKMNIEELFAGIGVVIDDKVFSSDEEGDRIVKIIKELENVRKFPLVKYADLPDDDVLTKLTNVSFLLLDWEIETKQDDLGEEAPNVQLGDVLKADNEKRFGIVLFLFLSLAIKILKLSRRSC